MKKNVYLILIIFFMLLTVGGVFYVAQSGGEASFLFAVCPSVLALLVYIMMKNNK